MRTMRKVKSNNNCIVYKIILIIIIIWWVGHSDYCTKKLECEANLFYNNSICE